MGEREQQVYIIGRSVLMPYQSQPNLLITDPKDLESVIYDPQGSLIGLLPPDRCQTQYTNEGGVIGNFFSKASVDGRNFRDTFAQYKPYHSWTLPNRLYTFGEALSTIVALKALASAGISPDLFDGNSAWIPKRSKTGTPLRVTVGFNNSVGPIEVYARGAQEGVTRHNAATLARSGMSGFINVAVLETLHTQGPPLYSQSACTTGLTLLHEAASKLANGESELAIIGAFEAAPNTTWLYLFNQLSAFAPYETFKNRPQDAPSPFARIQHGLAYSEGAGCFVLATTKTIQELGLSENNILVRIAGSSIGQDEARLNSPSDTDEGVRVVGETLKRADIQPKNLDIAVLHSTGTPDGEVYDWTVARRVFGLPLRDVSDLPDERHENLPDLTPPKSHSGHTYALSGILSGNTVIDAMGRDEIPPARTHIDTVHGMAVNPVLGVSKRRNVDHGLIFADGMDGSIASAVFEKPKIL